jgi:hypothetical protein
MDMLLAKGNTKPACAYSPGIQLPQHRHQGVAIPFQAALVVLVARVTALLSTGAQKKALSANTT